MSFWWWNTNLNWSNCVFLSWPSFEHFHVHVAIFRLQTWVRDLVFDCITDTFQRSLNSISMWCHDLDSFSCRIGYEIYVLNRIQEFFSCLLYNKKLNGMIPMLLAEKGKEGIFGNTYFIRLTFQPAYLTSSFIMNSQSNKKTLHRQPIQPHKKTHRRRM